ncbi:MAG TPA: VOC family protein [Gemmataceae bacterium]|nr:VOC family protein [Gemmataceae bacterium]
MTTTKSEFGLSQISQIAIIVHDLDKAIAFYRDTLGMRFLFQVPKMAFFNCGGIRLMLGIPEEPKFDHPASIIYYKVADIQGAYETLSARGVTFLGKPHLVAKLPDHDLWMAFLEDVDKNVLALMSEVRNG